MSDYTPTIEEARDRYADARVEISEWTRFDESVKRAVEEAYAEYDRMLAAHDAEVAAKALEEAADLAEGVECIVLDPVMEKIGKNVGLSLAQELRARAAEYRKAVQ